MNTLEKHSVAQIGRSPSDYGYDEAGQLTEKIINHSSSLDGSEKADVMHMFLQVLDDGRLTDGQERTVSFKGYHYRDLHQNASTG